MELGAFSVSLSVNDIAASRSFYEALGFSVFAGDQAQKWLMMRNGAAVVGLFEGMFEKNTLTFNPGWDQDARTLPSFTDVRDIQRSLETRGLVITQSVDPAGSGPGHLIVTDPDGNPILIDQHV